MPSFRLLGPSGQLLDEGDATVRMSNGELEVAPSLGQPLRVRLSDVQSITEPEPYVVALAIAEGTIELRQLGTMRTQLLTELGGARADSLATDLLLVGVGTPEKYPGAINDLEAEIRLYDDALVVIPQAGDPVQVPYSFVDGLTVDPSGYRFEVKVRGSDAVVLNRMARRTSEFDKLFKQRVTEARGRTSAFLGALLPGLGPIALRSTAGLLRDGLAAKVADLDAIDPTIVPAIFGAATLPDRRTGAEHFLDLADRGAELWVGFKQLESVATEAEGVEEWHDHSTTPNQNLDRSTGGLGTGLGGMVRASMMQDGPPRHLGFGGEFGGAMGNMLALSMLGMGMGAMMGGGGMMGGMGPAGMGPGGMGPGGMIGGMVGGVAGGLGFDRGGNQQNQPLPRQDVHRTRLSPAGVDLDKLSATGESPTVLAFAFLASNGHVAYEVLNQPDHATYVYRGGDVANLNRGLALLGFRVEGIYADASGAGSKYKRAVERLGHLQVLRDAYAGRAIHTDGWPDQLATLMAS